MELLKTGNGNIVRTEEEKTKMLAGMTRAYGEFLDEAGLDWRNDPNSSNTPHRYAKSFIEDFMYGCMNEEPKVTGFPNDGYDGVILQANIKVNSLCSHHHREIKGICHIAYIPGHEGKVVGLSKLNKIVRFYAKRPQIQEGLTQQIHEFVNKVCEGNRGVAVIVKAKHGCISCRGLEDDSTMVTSKLSGYFFTNEVGTRVELFNLISQAEKSLGA